MERADRSAGDRGSADASTPTRTSRHGLWRARWVRVASFFAFSKVAAPWRGLRVAQAWRAGDRSSRCSAAAPLTALAICAVLASTAATIHSRENMVWLVLYLAAAPTITLPVCLALGLFAWIRGGDGAWDRSARRAPCCG